MCEVVWSKHALLRMAGFLLAPTAPLSGYGPSGREPGAWVSRVAEADRFPILNREVVRWTLTGEAR